MLRYGNLTMSDIHLQGFDNSWYQPGRSLAWQAAWFFVGLPLLRSSLMPSSFIRVALLRIFGARVASGVVIKPGVIVKYPWHLVVGSNSWLGEACWIDNLTTVQIGSNVCVSQGAYLCTGNHDWTDPTFGLVVKPIELKDGAWIGAKVLVAPGVVVGECAIAAAGSVVTKNIANYEIHSGNPAVFTKRRYIGSTARERRASKANV